MNGIVSFWARNSVAANLLMLVMLVSGIIGFNSLEEEIWPSGTYNGAYISIAWPGASPQDVEDQLVVRLEEAMVGLDGLERITGRAREGSGSINLEAKESVDMNQFMEEVKQRVDSINNLPQSAYPPQISRWRDNQQYMGIAVHGPVDQLTMKRTVERIRDEIARLPGGELAIVWGVLDEEVSIEVSEDTLRRYDLTFDEVARAIRTSSINVSGGSIRTPTGQVNLGTRARADNAEEFGNIIVRQTVGGGTIRLSDIATIKDGFVDYPLSATFNGDTTAFVMINQPDEMHVRDYFKALDGYIDEFNARGNEPVKIDLLFSQSDFYERLWGTITSSAFLGACLVLVVLLLFLRPTVAFWVTAGVITAFAGGFAVLPYLGVSMNLLTLFAILLVVGVLVDDAIVVGENIHREVEAGRSSGTDAAIIGTQLVIKPVIFGVVTTMIMFAPWALVEGEARQFTQQITFVVVAALAFSLIESLLILPAHLGHMKPQKFDGAMGGFFRFQRRIADSLLWFASNVFKPVLEFCVRMRYATVAFFIVLFYWAMTLTGSGIVPFRFMPEIEADMVQVSIEMPEGSPFSRTLAVKQQLEDGIVAARAEMKQRYPGVEGEFITDASVVANDTRINAWIGAMPPENRPQGLSTKEISNVLRDAVGPIPDAEEVNFAFTFNDNQSGINFALNHPDLEVLRAAAEDVKAQLATYEATYDIGDNLSAVAPEVRMNLKPGAESLGLNLATVANQVRQAYYGEEVQRLPRDGEDVRVMLRYPESVRRDIDSLRDMRVRAPDGSAIPLEQVAQIDFAPGVSSILRRERTRSVMVRSELNGDVRRDIMMDMEQNFWPQFEQKYPGVTRGAVGGAQGEQEFAMNLMWLNIGAFCVMYVLLAIAFKSYGQPILLMMAIPFAFAGATFGHLLFGVPMAMFSLFGIGAAAGVVINDNLVLLDSVNRRREEGAGAMQAIVDSAVSRFRPILLTSVTTFVGILPMIAERSIDAQFLKPMVVSLGCAVGFALFVSLLFVPALYLVGVEIKRFFAWAMKGRPYRHIGESYTGDVTLDEEALGPGARPQHAE